MAEQKQLKISFQAKDSTTCPCCGEVFKQEVLLSGSGRLIAGALTDELHRLYEETSKFGLLYPLAYQAMVCPNCWFSAMDQDFARLPPDVREIALLGEAKRKNNISQILPGVDFYENRNLISGAAAQALVCFCYDYFSPEFSPTIKQGIASLRAGWLFDQIEKEYPGQNYDWLSTLFKKKAAFFYAEALRNESAGKETLSGITAFGPDTDKNYGYEGMLYLRAVLEYKYGSQQEPESRRAALADSKRTIAKIFGLGKSSKNKPGPLLERGKELYNAIGKEIEEFDD